ncbi:MAG TPA: hypothetical protein VLE47_02995 [Candidatus Saccharimonadales bacterium]|nr:hypothetical protein [Candidatus Saccharimonadales bacterium]
MTRDNSWLLSRLDRLWSSHFADVPQKNKVFIKFSRVSKFRFGSIRMHPRTKETLILINGKFKETSFPEEIVDHTIAHELVHYAHGFSSPNKKLHQYPHRGGVIEKELSERGLKHLSLAYKKWLKDYKKTLRSK